MYEMYCMCVRIGVIVEGYGWLACGKATTRPLTCVASPTNFLFLPILGTNPRLEAPLPLYFSCTTFRHSAKTPATPLIRKCTTRRWTLWCSLTTVHAAKRQQFWYGPRHCRSSLKMWFQRVGFDFSRAISKSLFYCCSNRYEHESWYHY